MLPEAAGQWLTRRAILAWTTAFFALVVVLAPASVMDWSVRVASGGRLGLSAPTGTFWSGSGYLTAVRGASADMPIRWRVLVHRLALAQLHLALAQGGGSEGTLTLSPWGLRLVGLDLSFPVALAGQAWAPLSQARLGGDARLRAESLGLSKGESAGRMQLVVTNLSSGLVATRPLGAYEMSVTGGERVARLGIKTISGPLNLTGSGTLEWAESIDFSGSLSAAADKQAELLSLMAIAGSPNSAGAVELRWSWRR